MSKILFPLFALLILCSISCNKDDDNNDGPEMDYVDFEVDFFLDHPDWHYIAPDFELVTEQVLTTPAHLDGAIFQLATELVLVKEAYQIYCIQDSVKFSVVQDVENFIATEITCYEFWEMDDLILLDIPAEYKTHYKRVVYQQGNGPTIPAEYTFFSRRVLKTPGALLAREGERDFQRVSFRIPDTLLIEDYLLQQIPAGLNCEQDRGYRIN